MKLKILNRRLCAVADTNKSWLQNLIDFQFTNHLTPYWNQFHIVYLNFLTWEIVWVCFMMMPAIAAISIFTQKWASTTEFDTFHSIYSIKESPSTVSMTRYWCVFDFIVWHTSILIIHLFYGWHGTEQSEADRGGTRRDDIDHQYFQCFINAIHFFLAMTSVNETSTHSIYLPNILVCVTLVEMIKCSVFMILSLDFVIGFWSAHFIYYFQSIRSQAILTCKRFD